MPGRSPRELRIRRHLRVRKRVGGSPERPRLSIFRSNIHIYAQVIDDAAGRTLVAASSKETACFPKFRAAFSASHVNTFMYIQ